MTGMKPVPRNMNLALVKKNLRDSSLLLLACSLWMFFIALVRLWIVSRVDTNRFRQIIEMLPGDFEKLSPVPFEWLITYPGRIALTYDEPVVALCLGIWCVARGSDCVSGEISRGTMEMLLSQPVSRLQVLVTHASVTILGIVIIALSSWVGLYIGIETFTVKEEVLYSFTIPILGTEIVNPLGSTYEVISPMREKVSPVVFGPAVLNFFCLGFFVTGISVLASSWDRYRWRTIGIVVSFIMFSSVIKVLALFVEPASWLMWCSFFTAFEPEVFVAISMESPETTWNLFLINEETGVRELGPLGYNLVLVCLGLASIVAGAFIFCRRDLPAPL